MRSEGVPEPVCVVAAHPPVLTPGSNIRGSGGLNIESEQVPRTCGAIYVVKVEKSGTVALAVLTGK